MDTKFFEDFHIIEGNICTPQGFIVDTFDCDINGLMTEVSIIMSDNPCTIAFNCPKYLQIDNAVSYQQLEDTKGIAQAVVLESSIELSNYVDFKTDISNILGLYDDNFLISFRGSNQCFSKNCLHFAMRFDICGVECSFGILKYNDVVYITTDVAITHSMIDFALKDVSLNDNILCVMASGQAGNMVITKDNYIFNIFKKALQCVVDNLY